MTARRRAVYGNAEPAFDLCELAHAAGATYVARGTSWAYRQLTQIIAGGLVHEGFSFVEAMAVCNTYYGRFNLTADAAEFLLAQKEHAVPVDRFEHGSPRLRDRYPVGVLHHVERPPYSDVYADGRRNQRGGRRSRAVDISGAPAGAAAGEPAVSRSACRVRVDRASCSPPRCWPTRSRRGPGGRADAELPPRGPRRRLQAEVIASTEADRLPRGRARRHLALPLAGGLRRYAARPVPGGLILYDSGLVDEREMPGVPPPRPAVHATADVDLGAKVVTNIVSIGSLGAFVAWLPRETVDAAVAARACRRSSGPEPARPRGGPAPGRARRSRVAIEGADADVPRDAVCEPCGDEG